MAEEQATPPVVTQGNATEARTETGEIKGDKVVVFKYKPKKDYRRTQGHRQRYTLLKVEDIQGA